MTDSSLPSFSLNPSREVSYSTLFVFPLIFLSFFHLSPPLFYLGVYCNSPFFFPTVIHPKQSLISSLNKCLFCMLISHFSSLKTNHDSALSHAIICPKIQSNVTAPFWPFVLILFHISLLFTLILAYLRSFIPPKTSAEYSPYSWHVCATSILVSSHCTASRKGARSLRFFSCCIFNHNFSEVKTCPFGLNLVPLERLFSYL